jgi:alkanesulfonate monooxygenase SsuD/methylene tetrahydromethanopterin reductase-like flavin-dependent oxidoreductase (luciferase family)
MVRMPALALSALPGQRRITIEIAAEAERRAFTGIYCPSVGDPVALCQAIAGATSTIPIGTAIEPIYLRSPQSLARTGALVHELAGGRFRLGVGVSHDALNTRYHLQAGKPLQDMRDYVAALRAMEGETGALPPIVLAALRNKMLDLACEIADGAILAGASRSFAARQILRIPTDKRQAGFFLANVAPTVIDADVAAADAAIRRMTAMYVQFPSYRNYWREAGYIEEMDAAEEAIAKGELDRLPSLMSDCWLADCCLYGSPATVREGVEAWWDAGIAPILTMSSTRGEQLEGVRELFDAYA